MAKFLKTLLLTFVVVGGVWLLMNKDEINAPQDVVRLAREKLALLDQQREADFSIQQSPYLRPSQLANRQSVPVIQSAHRRPRTSVRVASMMVDGSGVRSVDGGTVMLADMCCRYDIIALQGVRRIGKYSAVSLVERMNAIENVSSGGPRTSYRLLMNQQSTGATQIAIVYDETAVQLDNDRWYLVHDPDDQLVHEPMVAWFRARGVAFDQAFTFSLVNLQLDSHRPDRELRYLSELFRAVRADGRGEDDVIIAGNFNAGDRGLQPIQQRSGLTWVISGMPTNTSRTAQFDNIVFNPTATVEFTQRGGVFDFMKHYNLRLSDAKRISSHMPVWAEFNLQEGNAMPMMAETSERGPF